MTDVLVSDHDKPRMNNALILFRPVSFFGLPATGGEGKGSRGTPI